MKKKIDYDKIRYKRIKMRSTKLNFFFFSNMRVGTEGMAKTGRRKLFNQNIRLKSKEKYSEVATDESCKLKKKGFFFSDLFNSHEKKSTC